MIHSVKLYAQSLALEYNRSGQTVSVVEWSYAEAKAFSCEADWNINTAASVHWFSVHGCFFTIDGVGGFTNSHNDLRSTIEVDGYGFIVLIPNYFSIECFSQCTDRNHGSPVIINIWSSIASDNVVVYNIINRVDGHNNGTASEWICLTKGVFESSCIKAIIMRILNSYNNISSSFSVSIDIDIAFAVVYVLTVTYNFKADLSIFVALICDVSIQGAIDLSASPIFLNDVNSYAVVFIDRTFCRIKFQCECVVRFHNSQFTGNQLLSGSILCIYSDGSAQERFVSLYVCFGSKSITQITSTCINYGFTVSANDEFTKITNCKISICVDYNSIFINIASSYINKLSKSNLIIDIDNSITEGTHISSLNVKNGIFNGTKIINIERYSSIVITEKRYTYSVLTRNEVVYSGSICTDVAQSVYTTIPVEAKIVCSNIRIIWFAHDSYILVMVCTSVAIFISVSWFASQRTSYRIIFFVGDFKLNSIGEISLRVSPVVIITS